jgi:hypothetical protein
VSGPARRGVSDQPAARRSERSGGLLVGLLKAFDWLSSHRLLDRLIRGRIWIALVAFALIGIVTLQLGLLKLNGDIGRALEHEALVQRENAQLSIENSELAASENVEMRAGRMGMEFVPVGALRFLTARPGVDAAEVAGALSAQAHATGTGSGESQDADSTAADASSESSSGAEAPPTAEASSTEPASSTTSASSSGEAPASAPTEGTAPAGESSAGETVTPSTAPADSSAPATQAPGTATPSPTGAGSGEVSPAGGTQAAPTGG